MNTISGIQYLRGIAALMVVFHHALSLTKSSLQIGSEGVDIFFVISGFIMAHSTRSFSDNDNRIGQALTFLRKRFFRVVPLYWIALLWTIKFAVMKNGLNIDLCRDFLFIPRVHSTGRIWPELIVGWTLNYEVFFYLIFAASMAFGKFRYFIIFTTFIAITLFSRH